MFRYYYYYYYYFTQRLSKGVIASVPPSSSTKYPLAVPLAPRPQQPGQQAPQTSLHPQNCDCGRLKGPFMAVIHCWRKQFTAGYSE